MRQRSRPVGRSTCRLCPRVVTRLEVSHRVELHALLAVSRAHSARQCHLSGLQVQLARSPAVGVLRRAGAQAQVWGARGVRRGQPRLSPDRTPASTPARMLNHAAPRSRPTAPRQPNRRLQLAAVVCGAHAPTVFAQLACSRGSAVAGCTASLRLASRSQDGPVRPPDAPRRGALLASQPRGGVRLADGPRNLGVHWRRLSSCVASERRRLALRYARPRPRQLMCRVRGRRPLRAKRGVGNVPPRLRLQPYGIASSCPPFLAAKPRPDGTPRHGWLVATGARCPAAGRERRRVSTCIGPGHSAPPSGAPPSPVAGSPQEVCAGSLPSPLLCSVNE